MTLRTTIAVGLIAIPVLALMAGQRENRHQWTATDGDTVVSPSGERIRLLYIDAPEMPSSPRNCRRVHCPSGDPYASKAALQRALDSGSIRCDGTQFDRYGRRLAECFVTAPGGQTVSINSWLLARGFASPYQGRR